MARNEWRDVSSLRLHPVAAKLLEVADKAQLFPVGVRNQAIEVLADGTVVAGLRIFLQARRAGRKRVRVIVRGDLVDEDPAFVAGVVVKDVLAGTTDPIAVGTAWAAFRRFCAAANRPRKGYAKTKYERRFGMSPVERLAEIVRDTFGLSDDQLRRMEAILPLPTELHTALRAETVTLKSLVELAGQPKAVIAAVVTDVKAGTSPTETITRHLPPRNERPEARTALRRFLRAGNQAATDLAGRQDKIGYLRTVERAGLVLTRELIDTLLRLATEEAVTERVARILAAAKFGRGGAA